MDPEDVVDELYGLAPKEFVPRRDALAKQARGEGDRETAGLVAALRRPTAAAWLVNALVRHRGDDVDRLLDLGEAMRDAQAALAGEQLRALTVQRQQVVAAMARQARALAVELENPVSEAVAEEVAQTLRAALADPAVAEAVRSGRLTTAVSYAGMGEVDLADVVALAPRRRLRDAARSGDADGPTRGSARDHPDKGEDDERSRAEAKAREQARARALAQLDAARTQAASAQAQEQTAQDRSAAARDAFDAAQQRYEQARDGVREAEARLREAQAELSQAGEALGPVRRDRDAAVRAAATARTAARAARDRVAGLERDVDR